MSELINIQRCDANNVGDWFSTPRFYFDQLRQIPAIDIWNTDFSDSYKWLKNKTILYGGGGLFGNEDFENKLRLIMNSGYNKLICWGAGHNKHDGEEIDYSPYLSSFDLLGVRDDNVPGTQWVPCVSCMHSGFDKQPTPKHNIVVYEHKDHTINISGYPKINNRVRNIIDVIDFLNSAEFIITSTYHGVYWSTLLNKKVLLMNPFSSKFKGFRHKPVVATKENYLQKLEEAVNYPGALEECRNANILFSKKVFGMIS